MFHLDCSSFSLFPLLAIFENNHDLNRLNFELLVERNHLELVEMLDLVDDLLVLRYSRHWISCH